MIKLTLREAAEVSKALAALPRINAKAAYDLARIRDKIKAAWKPVEEQRQQIIADNGGEVMDNGVVKWTNPDGQVAADKTFGEFLDHEIEIDREPVKLAAVLGSDPAKYPDIEPERLSILEKIIVE